MGRFRLTGSMDATIHKSLMYIMEKVKQEKIKQQDIKICYYYFATSHVI